MSVYYSIFVTNSATDSMFADVFPCHVVAEKIDSFKVQGALLGALNKRSCLKGTRTAVMKQITDWIQSADADAPRVLWLSGMAGTGKSTIAYTIAREYQEQSRLGAFFAFNRSDPSASMAKNLFPPYCRIPGCGTSYGEERIQRRAEEGGCVRL